MGSYYIPSNKLKGEGRILYIFTTKSLIYTAVGGLIGLLFYLLFTMLGLKTIGIIIMAVLAVIGFGIGSIKMPTTGNTKLAKNVGGDSIDEIILNYIKFKKNKKIYTYAIKREEPDYNSISSTLDILNISKLTHNDNNTKEENK